MAERAASGGTDFGLTSWRMVILLVGVGGLLSGSNAVEYFTIQSNLIVIAYYVVALIGRRGTMARTPAPRLRAAMTSYILLTGIVYHFVLHDAASPFPGLFAADPTTLTGNWSQFLLHYVIPVMVFIEWIVWGPRRRLRWRDGLLWAVYPLGYLLVIIVRGLVLPGVSDRYPYPFLDPNVNGWDGVAAEIVQVVLVYAIIAVIMLLLDRLLPQIDLRDDG